MQMSAAGMTLLMPTFNSLRLRDQKSSQPLLEQAIDSLLGQTHHDFELVILDNMSSDGTADYLRQVQQIDSRVRVHIDTENRGPEEAIKVLTGLHESHYCVIVNDDDLWAHDYLERLSELRERTDADVAYCAGRFMSMSGRVLSAITTNPQAVYGGQRSSIDNFQSYLEYRNPFPISFGIWRRELLDTFYPARRFNEFQDNLDNLFIANALRSGPSIAYLDEELFFYRNKPRPFRLPEAADGSLAEPSSVDLFTRRLIHELSFAGALLSGGQQADTHRGSHESPVPWTLVILRTSRSALARSLMAILLMKRATRAEHRTLLAFRTRHLQSNIAALPWSDAQLELAQYALWLDELANSSQALASNAELHDSLRSTLDAVRAAVEQS